MQGVNLAVLTYHSQNIRGAQASNNDHVALTEDLEAIHQHGLRVIPLGRALSWISGELDDSAVAGAICLAFDDGCDFDIRDLEYPGHGLQRSFLGIMQDFVEHHGEDAQAGLHATSFVIANSEARQVIDTRSLFGKGWISDDWWWQAAANSLLSIGNHGWDHNHPDLDPADSSRGGFATVNTLDQCLQQVVFSAEIIMEKAGSWPELFAYPFGESSAYIREEFFPLCAEQHRCRAAFGTDPGMVTRDSDRWNLPRYVCGRDWQSSEELLALLSR